MNARQSRKLNSYAETRAVLTSSPVTAGVFGLPERIAEFCEEVDAISSDGVMQMTPTAGLTAQRHALLDAVRDRALEVAYRLMAYADSHHRADLVPLIKVNPSTFETARFHNRLLIAARIHTAGESVVHEAALHGVTPDVLADLLRHIDAAHDGLSAPCVFRMQRKAATERLAARMRRIDRLLENQIDRLVFLTRRTAPRFFADYQASRRIHGGPRRRHVAPAPAALAVADAPDTRLAA